MKKNKFFNIKKDILEFSPNPQWDDDTLIEYYKKKTREICAHLEEESKIQQRQIILNHNNKYKYSLNRIQKKNKLHIISSGFRSPAKNKSRKRKVVSANPMEKNKNPLPKLPVKEETESVLNMLFPYVNENDFKIEPFKSGEDLRNENRGDIPVIRLNQERRIKSNFVKKFKKYDKELNTYADNPSIRCSSAYATEDQIRRREFIESKKYWMTNEDFKRVFGKKTESDKIKEMTINEKYVRDKYIEPLQMFNFRNTDRNKWVSKKNFIV